jgi:hypothetical protein
VSFERLCPLHASPVDEREQIYLNYNTLPLS